MTVSRVAMQLQGTDFQGNVTTHRTDAAGRTKISHAQPAVVTGSLTASGDVVGAPVEGLADVFFYITVPAGATNANVFFEQSPDATSATSTTPWYPVLAKNHGAAAAANTSTGGLTAGTSSVWKVTVPAAAYVRARLIAAPAAGTLSVLVGTSTSATPTEMTVDVVNVATVNSWSQVINGNGLLTGTVLGAGQTATTATIDRSGNSAAHDTRVRPVVRHNAGVGFGHLILQESVDANTWRETRRTPVPSDNMYHSFDWPVHLRYWRLLFVNGGVAQTNFDLLYSSLRTDGNSIDVSGNLLFPLSVTPIGASSSFTSPVLDLGANHNWNTVRVFASADQPGTLFPQWSFDNGGFKSPTNTNGIAVTSNAVADGQFNVIGRYLRFVYNNGTTAQTTFQLGASLLTL